MEFADWTNNSETWAEQSTMTTITHRPTVKRLYQKFTQTLKSSFRILLLLTHCCCTLTLQQHAATSTRSQLQTKDEVNHTIVEIHLTFIDKSLSITYFAKTFLTDSGRASLSSITSPSTKVKAHMSIKRWNTKQTHHINHWVK